jgi:hypothetical protein
MIESWRYGLGRSSVRINASDKTPYLEDLTSTRPGEGDMKKQHRKNRRKEAKRQK